MQNCFIRLHSGHLFDILNPNPDYIEITDIALALSHISRFTGHTNTGYSVAQHSINLANHITSEHALAALMHDAAEAYIGDISTPVKSLISRTIRPIEYEILRVIFNKYNIPFPTSMIIDRTDIILMELEGKHFLKNWECSLLVNETFIEVDYSYYPPHEIAEQFINKFKEYKTLQGILQET